ELFLHNESDEHALQPKQSQSFPWPSTQRGLHVTCDHGWARIALPSNLQSSSLVLSLFSSRNLALTDHCSNPSTVFTQLHKASRICELARSVAKSQVEKFLASVS